MITSFESDGLRGLRLRLPSDSPAAELSLRPIKMSNRTAYLLGIALASGACGPRDQTITRGADGAPEWSRRLSAAVRVGTTADAARSVMEANGFHCREGADSVAYLWCDKLSAKKALVQRRWQAVINLNSQRRVYEVRASTGLIGP